MTWDGDALAERMEEAAERAQEAAEARARKTKDHTSHEERTRQAQLESLRLSRARTLSQLERATNPAHRAMLEKALAAINEQLGQ